MFVPPANNIDSKNNDKTVLGSENVDKGKSILGAPPKQDKKEIKNLRVKKGNTQKSKQKKQHHCHHCRAIGHTRPNCYKVSHSTEQQYDLIGKLESVSIFLCFSWRSTQSPHVPFKLERFQIFPLTVGSRVC